MPQSKSRARASAVPATTTTDIPAPTPAAAPSVFEQHIIKLSHALMELESCNDDAIEDCYQAVLPPLHALIRSLVDDSLERIYQRQRDRITNSWDRDGLRAKFVYLKQTWRRNLMERISQ